MNKTKIEWVRNPDGIKEGDNKENGTEAF